MKNITDVLIELSNLSGPAGFEKAVTDRVLELIKPNVDEAYIDVLGNVVGVKRCGKENATKLLFDAHIDEIGLIITGVEEGFLRFSKLGGLDARVLPSLGITVMTEPPMFGVIGTMPPHVLREEDTENVIKIEDLFIDVGLSQEEAEKAVPTGTPAVMLGKARRFGDNGLCGKALDDRAGFAAILWALDMLKDVKLDVDLYVMASVQEEVGCRGAKSGVYAINPDYCAVVDVNYAKTPDTKPHEASDVLGEGVSIARGPNMNAGFTEMAIDIAKKQNIKHQICVEPGGHSGTNAAEIQISREGVATALFGIPMKNMHTAYEIISLDDVECTAKLLCEVAQELK